MIEGEIYLLEAVRDTIRAKCGLKDHECDCEFDEHIPAIAGDRYVAVIPAGLDPGPNHQKSSGVHDSLHAVQIYVVMRCSNIARDRRRNVFLHQLGGVNELLSRIIKVLDWQLDLHSLTNHLLAKDVPSAHPFIEPLRLSRVDSKPRMVNSETFAGASISATGTTPYVAMVRSAYFGRCRRVQTVVQTQPIRRAPQ